MAKEYYGYIRAVLHILYKDNKTVNKLTSYT